MSNNKSKRGFTLIELLTVVLILSILAVIAVPKYFTQVEIARSREIIDILRQWQAARAIYFAEHDNLTDAPTVAQTNNTLQITIPDTSNFNCGFYSDSILCGRHSSIKYTITANDNHMFCCPEATAAEQPIAHKVCKLLSNNEEPQNSGLQGTAGLVCYEIVE